MNDSNDLSLSEMKTLIIKLFNKVENLEKKIVLLEKSLESEVGISCKNCEKILGDVVCEGCGTDVCETCDHHKIRVVENGTDQYYSFYFCNMKCIWKNLGYKKSVVYKKYPNEVLSFLFDEECIRKREKEYA